MDLAQMRKVNEMARTLRQHGFATDAQAAAAQSETFFVNTNEQYYPHETKVSMPEQQESPSSQEAEAQLQEEQSGSEVSLGILHDTYDRMEQLENTFQDKVEAVENDVSMIIEKVNELINVMKSLEEKQDSVEQQLQRSTVQTPAPAPVAEPTPAQEVPAQAVLETPVHVAPTPQQPVQAPAQHTPSEAPTQPSQRTGELQPGDVDLNNFFYYGQR